MLKRLNNTLLTRLCLEAAESHRQRVNFNLHESTDDSVQRFLNVMQPGTYVRPHRHNDPVKWELTVALSGRIAILTLDNSGTVSERIELDAIGLERGIEIPAGTWHTSAVLSPDTVLLEVKPGPYDPRTDKEFAVWAPPEGSVECIALERRILAAQPGEVLSSDPLKR